MNMLIGSQGVVANYATVSTSCENWVGSVRCKDNALTQSTLLRAWVGRTGVIDYHLRLLVGPSAAGVRWLGMMSAWRFFVGDDALRWDGLLGYEYSMDSERKRTDDLLTICLVVGRSEEKRGKGMVNGQSVMVNG
jgi:hypothetical protein